MISSRLWVTLTCLTVGNGSFPLLSISSVQLYRLSVPPGISLVITWHQQIRLLASGLILPIDLSVQQALSLKVCVHPHIHTDTLWTQHDMLCSSEQSARQRQVHSEGSYLQLCCALLLWRLIKNGTWRTESGSASPIPSPLLLPKCHLSSPLSYKALHYYSTSICLILTK